MAAAARAERAAAAVDAAAGGDAGALLAMLRRGITDDGGAARQVLADVGVSGVAWAAEAAALAEAAAEAAAAAGGSTERGARRHAECVRKLPARARAAVARSLAGAASAADGGDADGIARVAHDLLAELAAERPWAHGSDSELSAWWLAHPKAHAGAVDRAVAAVARTAGSEPADSATADADVLQLARGATRDPLVYAATHRRLRLWLRKSSGHDSVWRLLSSLAAQARAQAVGRARRLGMSAAAAISELYPLGAESLARASCNTPSKTALLALAAELQAFCDAGAEASAHSRGDREDAAWMVLLDSGVEWELFCLRELEERRQQVEGRQCADGAAGAGTRGEHVSHDPVMSAAAAFVARLLAPISGGVSIGDVCDGLLHAEHGPRRAREWRERRGLRAEGLDVAP